MRTRASLITAILTSLIMGLTTFISVLAGAGVTPVEAASSATPSATPATNKPAQQPQQSTVKVVLRNGAGLPITGALCEVLSYDWGLQIGEADHVVARGETDSNGSVTFDDTPWPPNGYRFHFTPTNHTVPAGTYFDKENDYHYQEYPGADLKSQGTTDQHETEYFVLFNDGIVYNDLSGGQGTPRQGGVAVGGMSQPRVTIMPSQDFFATARAVTATAFASNGGFETAIARNLATATAQAATGSGNNGNQAGDGNISNLPPEPDPNIQNVPTEAPTPVPGVVGAPLSVTPVAEVDSNTVTTGPDTTQATSTTTTTTVAANTTYTAAPTLTNSGTGSTTTTTTTGTGTVVAAVASGSGSSSNGTGTVTPATGAIVAATGKTSAPAPVAVQPSLLSLLTTTILAIAGVWAAIWFWRNRAKVDAWLGIENSKRSGKQKAPRRPKPESAKTKPNNKPE